LLFFLKKKFGFHKLYLPSFNRSQGFKDKETCGEANVPVLALRMMGRSGSLHFDLASLEDDSDDGHAGEELADSNGNDDPMDFYSLRTRTMSIDKNTSPRDSADHLQR
jgi:hypothetical protein